jgi:hypothetical protein
MRAVEDSLVLIGAWLRFACCCYRNEVRPYNRAFETANPGQSKEVDCNVEPSEWTHYQREQLVLYDVGIM